MSEHPVVLGLSIPGTGELQAIAGDLAAKLAQYGGGAEGTDAALAEAVRRLLLEVGGSNGDQDISLVYRSEGGQASVSARCGARASEVRIALQR